MKGNFTLSTVSPGYWLRRTAVMLCALTIPLITASAKGSGSGEFPSRNAAYESDEVQAPPSKTKTISGQVFDEQGVPLIGAAVIIKNTSRGVNTDTEGKFSLAVPDDGKVVVLSISYVGMKTRDIGILEQTSIKVRLQPDTEIDEVVVTGYGVVQRREDLVGSAYQVTAKKLELMPVASVDKMLDGLVPGMTVTSGFNNNDESMRARMTVRIRGDASLNAANNPLWVVDGAPIYTGDINGMTIGTSYTVAPLSFLNPNDIESITVLKDASTTALYGADGANGVILITTKSGQAGKTSVNASVKYGIAFANESTRFKVLNASQYMQYAQEAWTNAGYPISAFPYQDNEYNSYSTTDTKWHDLYLDVGQTLQVDVSASGGNDRMKNYISGGYYTEDMILKGNRQQRISLRANSSYKLTRTFEASLSLSGTYNINNIFPSTRNYYMMLPIFSPYENDGHTYRLYNYYSRDSYFEYAPRLYKFTANDLPERDQNDNDQYSLNAQMNASLKWEPIQGLSVTTQFVSNYISTYEGIYNARTNLSGYIENTPMGQSYRSGVFNLNWASISRINFSRQFGRHRINALAGLEFKDQTNRYLNVSGYGFINDQIKEINYVSDANIDGGSNTDFDRSLSYMGQAAYSYDDRYYLTANVRRQGFSEFGEYSRWATFGSIGLGWNIHNEKFFRSKVFDTLKLKGSFGTSGNSRISSSSADGSYSISTSYSYLGNMGALQSAVANPGLTWETTYMTNIGVSIGLFKRLMIDAEFYNNLTDDMLTESRVSTIVSEDTVLCNIGKMRNRGYEISIVSANIVHPEFTWRTELNIAHNKNRIISLYEGITKSFGSYVWEEGRSKNEWYLIRWVGIDPADGKPMWYDKRGNLTKIYNYDNRVGTGKTFDPALFGSMTNILQWKNFTLRFMLNYTIGGWQYTSMDKYGLNGAYDIIEQNAPVEVLDHWTAPGQLSLNPRPAYKNDMHAALYNDRFLHRRTHVRLQNVALTYKIPETVCRKLRMSSASVSLVGDNVYLWTPDQKRGKNSFKTTMNSGYPMTTTYSINLSATF